MAGARLRVVAALTFLGAAVPAAAQATLPDGEPGDVHVKRQIRLALTNIDRARCSGETLCAKATPAELADPPITVAEARGVIRRSLVSATAEHCGLDWQGRNFSPMMAYWRGEGKTDRQLALIALLHGIAQGQVRDGLSSKQCTDLNRRYNDSELTFRP